MTSYLHGSETQRNTADTVTINGVDTAVIALVGIAPIFDIDTEYKTVNKIVPIQNTTDAARYFGKTYFNYTIPAALEDIFKQGGAKVFVINVFDPTKHKSSVSTSKTFENGKITLSERGIANLVVTKESTPCALGTDYTFENGVISVKTGGALTNTSSVTIAYDYADVTKVTAADILGGVDEDGIKTGAELIKDIKAIYGFEPTIVISPAYTCLNAVKSGLEIITNKLAAYLYIDAPMNTSLKVAIEGRGSNGTINFGSSNELVKLLHHHYKVYNKTEDAYEYRYASPFAAGLRANLDRTKGVHYSSSNHPIYGIEGVDVPVSFALNDFDCDANTLNSYGITTTINVSGEYREWGNRNASFPVKNGIMTFESCVRTINYIEKSIEKYKLNEIDGPINTALIDRILNKITDFFSEEKKKGTIIDGEAWYDSAKNPASQLSNGLLVISYATCPPPPFERARYEHDVKIQYLENIGGEQ